MIPLFLIVKRNPATSHFFDYAMENSQKEFQLSLIKGFAPKFPTLSALLHERKRRL